MRHNRVSLIAGCLILCLLGFNPIAAADTSGRQPAVQIEKTFDHGTLITHTLKAQQPPHTVWLYLNQRRVAEGADTMAHAHLRLRYAAPEGAPPMTRAEFDSVFEGLMAALGDNFGPHLELESLGSGGFLGVKAIEKNSALAFRDFAPWMTYLEKPAAFTQWQSHAIVLARWKTAKVFAPVIAALGRAGYDAELSGFEKLFVIRVDASKIRPELEALGIPGGQKLPYPGMVAFTIKPRR